MAILVVGLVVIIASIGAVLYFYYPKVLGIELPGQQLSQVHAQNCNDYFSLQLLSVSNHTIDTEAIFSTNQYGKINWQSSNIVINTPWWGFEPPLIIDTFNTPLHSSTPGTLYLCYFSDQYNPEQTTSNYILAFNASNGKPEATYQYNISVVIIPDFFVYDDNTFYFGALTYSANRNIEIEAYNYNINGIVSQSWNCTIVNVSNGGWGTGSDIVGLSNGYLNVTFLEGNLAGQTYLLNASTGELIH